MYDPMTQAFRIPFPWRSHGSEYRSSFITIWHVDPESDGTDDSCGYIRPKLSADQLRRIKSFAKDEAQNPWYQAFCGKTIDSPTEAQTLLAQIIYLVGSRFTKDYLCKPAIKPVTYAEAYEWAMELLCCPIDNLRSSLCFLPGWHSNNREDQLYDREYSAERLFYCVASFILRKRRPWYRHPKWHIWHWHIQIHPLQTFKRWAFSRCADCGGRFKWGESPWTNQWDSDGPRWFKSEYDVHHSHCPRPHLTENKPA